MIFNRLVVHFLLFCVHSFSNADDVFEWKRSECRDSPNAIGTIVKGNIAPRLKWPWNVALVTRTDKMFYGGGSLISERFVLTAAHCLQYKGDDFPKSPNELIVYLGKWNLTDETEKNAVKAISDEFFIHPDWKPSSSRWDADIALIRLITNVTFSKYIHPVCLWTSKMSPAEINDSGTVVGW